MDINILFNIKYNFEKQKNEETKKQRNRDAKNENIKETTTLWQKLVRIDKAFEKTIQRLAPLIIISGVIFNVAWLTQCAP